MNKAKYFTLALVLAEAIALAPLTQAQPAPTKVVVVEVVNKTFIDNIEALGTLRANESVELTATVTELISSINFSDGQQVKKGKLLVQMDDAEEQAELAEELSRLAEAERQYARLAPLAQKGAASESKLDELSRNVATAEARINAIRARLQQRKIVAPFDGVLGLREVSVGTLLQPSRKITTIDDIAKMKLDFSVPSVFLAALKPGVTVKATTKAYPGRIYVGNIASVDSRIDPVTRSIVARAILDNANGELKPGLLMQVTIEAATRETLVIPEEAVIPNGDKHFVLVVTTGEQGSIANQREIQIGARRIGEVEIMSGLSVGEQLITHGTLKVRNGASVSIAAVQTGAEPVLQTIKQNTATAGH